MVKKPRLFIALCTLPALILTIVFMIVPMVNAIYLSFTSSTALSVGFNSKFVFLDNYKYMFQDKDFLQALFNTLKLMLVIPAVTIFLSLVFAFILTQGQLKEKSFYRTVFFFPSIVSMTVVGIVWSFVFNPTRGILNHMLDLFHLPPGNTHGLEREKRLSGVSVQPGVAGYWLLYGYACGFH